MNKSEMFVLQYGIGSKSVAVNSMELWLKDQWDLYAKKRSDDILILNVFDDEEAAYVEWVRMEPHCDLAVAGLQIIRSRKGKKV